jgi:hypothetical protein
LFHPRARPISDRWTAGRGDKPLKSTSPSDDSRGVGGLDVECARLWLTRPGCDNDMYLLRVKVSADRRGGIIWSEFRLCQYGSRLLDFLDQVLGARVCRGDSGTILASRDDCLFNGGIKASSPCTVSSVRPGLELGARASTAAGGASMLDLGWYTDLGERGDWSSDNRFQG